MFASSRRCAAYCALAVLLLIAARPAVAQELPPLDPESPMAPLPNLSVDWPDLDARDPLEAAPSEAATVEVADEQRYAVTLEGLDGLSEAVTTRFDTLSVLKEGEGRSANAAQIERRARDDAELLATILESEGYYDAEVDTEVAADGGRLRVTLTAEPGTRYSFTGVTVSGLGEAPEARTAFGVNEGTPVDAETVVAGESALRESLGRKGFPFARVPEPQIIIDHETRAATLALNVETGGERRIGAIRMLGERPPFDAKHAAVIARFRPGELYNQELIDDLRRAIIATGLASTVRVEPVEAGPGLVDIATTIEPAPPRTVAGEIGYGTGEGFRIEASWQHRNLIRPEGAVTFRGVAGTKEQLLGANLRMGNFRRRDQVLNARAVASYEQRRAFDAYSFELGANLERQTNIIWQKKWTYSFGFEIIASDERDFEETRGVRERRQYLIGALPATLGYDGSDDLLDPTTGYRLSGRISPEASLSGSVFGYAKAQLDGSAYVPVGAGTVIAGRARLGAIVGASRNIIAPSRLFYAGGGGSVRGYGYQEIGPLNPLGEPIGGRSLAEFSLEARVRLKAFGGNFGIVPFVDAGNVYRASFPEFSGLRLGAGVGARYYSNFGPIRIDVGTPINRRPGESVVAVYVSLGQAF